MKDAEFLELLNLYLDHEISPADAARLEQEVQANPARRALYREYCQMQKACGVLAAEFAGGSGAEVSERSKVVAWSESGAQRRPGRTVWLGGAVAAMAAAVTLVFWYAQPTAEGPATLAATGGAGTPATTRDDFRPAAEVRPAALALAPRESFAGATGGQAGGVKVSLVAAPLVLSGSLGGATLAETAVGTSDGDQFSWIGNLQIVSMQERTRVEMLRFDTAPPSLRPEGRPLGGRAPVEATAETAAFRFVK
ncbi:MAG: zf-HC2 domain-containing protein [Verrucomicrobia bacterium]|nr:zf-HC2 domain-containing protein [Verrucomicrobiota bacterium]